MKVILQVGQTITEQYLLHQMEDLLDGKLRLEVLAKANDELR